MFQSRLWAHAVLFVSAACLGCAVSEEEDQVVCGVVEDDSDCEVCVKTGCCDAYMACERDAACGCIFDCADAGKARAQCATMCDVTETEISDVLGILNGDQQNCDVQCDDQCADYVFDDDDD